jgi:hypothetical protein
MEKIMTDLVERYVHQVGRYLPPKERAEIEAELRSQLYDQLEDRFDGAPSQADIVAALAEFGHPQQIASAYAREQYLVGPVLYPFMLKILRYGWLIIPLLIAFVNIFAALVAPTQPSLPALLLEILLGVVQAAFIFSALVVFAFALLQNLYTRMAAKAGTFNPLTLPKVDDPGSVDRFGAASGVAVGTIVALALLYFLRVGGLTLRFNLSDPGDVLPVPATWLLILVAASFSMVIMQLFVLWRTRWSSATWLVQTLLELVGIICLYFVFYEPVLERLVASVPAFASLPFAGSSAEILAVLTAASTLLTRGRTQARLWNESHSAAPAFPVRKNA